MRRLRVAGFTLVGEPVAADAAAEPALDLHAGVAELIDGSGDESRRRGRSPPPAPPWRSRWSARPRPPSTPPTTTCSAPPAWPGTPASSCSPAGSTPPWTRRSRRPACSTRSLPPSALLVDTLGTLAGVLADLELMPLALDYQRRAHEAATAAAADPGALGPDDGDPDVLVAADRHLPRRALRRAGRGPARRRRPRVGRPALRRGPPAGRARRWSCCRRTPPASSPPRSCTAGRWSGSASTPPRSARCAPPSASPRPPPTAPSWPPRSWRWAGRCAGRATAPAADEHLVSALTLATEHGLPRLRRAALRELCTLHAELDDAGRALPYLQAYLSDELDRVDERRTRWVELFGRRKSLLETERAAGQLRRQAYEDPLTHLPNRRYAEARLDGLLSAGAAPALAVVDVDRFKAVNDAIGHPGGDAVLRIVGELLIAGVRDTDEVCRWAGDEYVILLPDTTAEQAERALERTRRKVADLRLGRARPRPSP